MTPALKLGWATFALVAVVLVAYSLNQGVFVGSSIGPGYADPLLRYHKQCHYLFPTGVAKISSAFGRTPEEADEGRCRLFGEGRSN